MSVSWREFNDADACADYVASSLLHTVGEAMAARGRAMLVLSGGRTPRVAYERLAARAAANGADYWQALTLVPSDERFVPPDHADSNERMLRNTLLTNTTSQAGLVSLWVPGLELDMAAQAADARVRGLPRPFDAVLLGMGDDGHIASLFPGGEGTAAALDPASSRCVAAIRPAPGAPPPHVPRLTLTLACLLQTRRLCLLIAGERKRALLQAALQQAGGSPLPVAGLLQQDAPPLEIIWQRGELG